MTLAEFIEKLKAFDPSLPIAFQWDSRYSSPQAFDLDVSEKDKDHAILVIDVSSYNSFEDERPK